MSIALGRNRGSSVERPAFIHPVPVVDSADERGVTGNRRSLVQIEEDSVSCSSSSIGKNSDVSSESSEDEGSGEAEVQSSFKGPLDSLDALEEVLPMRRGISIFYNGKSKSFTSLADAVAASSVEEFAKPENPYTRKRKNLLAHSPFFGKNQNHPIRSSDSDTSKRPPNSNTSKAFTSKLQRDSNEGLNFMASSTCHRPPLHPPYKKSPNIGPSSPPQQWIPPCRSFSLTDLQCVAAGTPNLK